MDEKKLKMHRAFWSGERTGRPLYGFSLGSYFPAKRYKAAESLLVDKLQIIPEMLRARDYLPDYEEMFQQTLSLQQDLTLVASPYTGIPWMEAILGCEILGGKSSITARPQHLDWHDIEPIAFDPENPWVKKYMEFNEELMNLSRGRFPVGQPILRGPSDMMSCIRGHQEYATDYIMYPRESLGLQKQVTSLFIDLITFQQNRLSGFSGGTGFGFYDIWCPGKAIWYQEDASGLLSPKLFDQFLKLAGEEISRVYPYNLIHLHPASLYALDSLLALEPLRVIQITKDIGATMEQLIPHFKKVIAHKKRLVVWGDLSLEEVQSITGEVPMAGVALNIVAEKMDTAQEISEWLQSQN